MPENHIGNQLIRISVALGVIITIAVGLRLLARWRSKANFAVDDVLIVISLLPQYVMIILAVLVVRKAGMGHPGKTLSTTQLSTFLKLMMSGIVTYSLTIIIVKLSILLLYRRIFVTERFKRTTLAVGTLCLIWFFIAIFMDILMCHPFNAAFNVQMLFTKQCIDLESFYLGATGANLVIDVIMLYLPIHMVWGLQLPRRQKFSLSGVFMLGGFVCVAGAMRIVAIGNMKVEDVTMSFTGEYIWTQVEPATAILCACLVTYRPLFTNISFKFSKVSAFLSRGSAVSKGLKGSRQDGWEDREAHSDAHQHPLVGRDSHERETVRFHNRNAKGTKDDLHIINVDQVEPGSEISGTYTGSIGSIDAMGLASNRTKPPYHPQPFRVTGNNTVLVEPFA